MLFNSLDFAIFLPLVFLTYWFVFARQLKAQNLWVVIVSCVFYAWWDWFFLVLMMLSSVIEFVVGLAIAKTHNRQKRRLYLGVSLVLNLGMLCYFKYVNFFIDNFNQAFRIFGSSFSIDALNVILPVGISFYTFQTISYSIDVYRRQLKPTHDFVAFMAFVTFFPQLVAGPIERATHLLPQFYKKRHFDIALAKDGLRQILWGLFKKMVIADSCAQLVNADYAHFTTLSGSSLLIASALFAIQIYGDFSGYSDIAIGVARLFGFQLMRNFAFPYFSRSIAEFWRRWHISLSTWFRDYIYFPMGGSRGSRWQSLRNVFVLFLISGFWHGANWTFVSWGALNALLFIPGLIWKNKQQISNTVAENTYLPSLLESWQMLRTFLLCTLTWVFFRAENSDKALQILAKIVAIGSWQNPHFQAYPLLFMLVLFFGIEWLGRQKQHPLEHLQRHYNKALRWSIYSFLICCIWMYLPSEQSPFIYFQF
ncbi:MAG: hypothetical protein RLZZ301_210 [Bacteroidota bacterium]